MGSQPQLCLHGLSYHLLLGEGSPQLIQILPLRWEEGVKIAEHPASTSPAGCCAQQAQEFTKARPRHGSSATAAGRAEDGDVPR